MLIAENATHVCPRDARLAAVCDPDRTGIQEGGVVVKLSIGLQGERKEGAPEKNGRCSGEEAAACTQG
jgi:hypothetical protein